MPMKENLVRQTIIEDRLCDCCHVDLETPLHALWLCHELDIVWSDPELWHFRRSVHFRDFKELLSWLILQEKNPELFAVMAAWSIWIQRNQVRLHQTASALHQVEQLSRDTFNEFLACQATPLPRQPRA